MEINSTWKYDISSQEWYNLSYFRALKSPFSYFDKHLQNKKIKLEDAR